MSHKRKKSSVRSLTFTFKQRRIEVLLDKVLIFRFIRNLHGRFWGLAGILVMIIGFTVCFLIRQDMIHPSTAFSDFGSDTRTAPYFAGSVFFGAYGMWRWRNYLARTWKRSMLVQGLITLTVLGLYLVALMPVSWRPIPHTIHMFGVSLAGISMLTAVVVDSLLTKPHDGRVRLWRFTRFVSFVSIIVGGVMMAGSTEWLHWFNLSLVGESLVLWGYLVWIVFKTYAGEGNTTVLARILKKFVFID
ncbi:MAG TPA: hypothetical protein VIR03_03840 [Candidatus Saccharimonadales bacterium]